MFYCHVYYFMHAMLVLRGLREDMLYIRSHPHTPLGIDADKSYLNKAVIHCCLTPLLVL